MVVDHFSTCALRKFRMKLNKFWCWRSDLTSEFFHSFLSEFQSVEWNQIWLVWVKWEWRVKCQKSNSSEVRVSSEWKYRIFLWSWVKFEWTLEWNSVTFELPKTLKDITRQTCFSIHGSCKIQELLKDSQISAFSAELCLWSKTRV